MAMEISESPRLTKPQQIVSWICQIAAVAILFQTLFRRLNNLRRSRLRSCLS